MYLCLGLFEFKACTLQRAAGVLDGTGTVMHHSSVLLYVEAMMLAGVFHGNLYLLSGITFPVVQYWFTLLQYAN